MNVLEMEEAESMVGTGRRKTTKANPHAEGVLSWITGRNFLTYIVGGAMLALILLLYASTKDSTESQINMGDVEFKSPTSSTIPAPVTTTTTTPDDEDQPDSTPQEVTPPVSPPTAATSSTTPQPQSAAVEDSPTEPEPSPTTSTTNNNNPLPTPDVASNAKDGPSDVNFYSKVATQPPLIDPPFPDEATAAKWAEIYGKWSFWDGDEDMRPKTDFLSKYPNKDCPGDEFPDDAWQVDAVFVNHYLNEADALVARAMEAIFAEYGKGREGLEPQELTTRKRQFHWEQVDLSTATDAPPEYQRKGGRGTGGWTTTRSQKGLERRLLHAMMTSDTFTVVMGGHSAAAGEGNHFKQNYMMQFHKVMAPIFARLGVKLITRNVAMGGLGTIQHALGSAGIYGDEIDLLLWDSGMTEGRDQPAMDMFLRQGLIGGKRVPVIWGYGIDFDLLKNVHENADADIGEFGSATEGLPLTESRQQAETLPWAVRYLHCAEDAQDLCREMKYCNTCWQVRNDGIEPKEHQAQNAKGQTNWHPGWRVHQLTGRNLAMAVLQSLQSAINIWTEHVLAGPPLADEFWHVTDYYDNIRSKVMNMDPTLGKCHGYDGRLPPRMCSTPMKGITHYTPRATPERNGIINYVKPTDGGYLPINEESNLFDGPDPLNPCMKIPDGEVDVYAIVSGRRKLHVLESWAAEDTMLGRRASSSDVLFYNSNRSLESGIVPGKGWQMWGEPAGYCDGSYYAECNRAGPCVLQGNQVGRGAIIGNEWSGWLVLSLKDLSEGIIVLKLHTWHTDGENTITKGWSTVNNERHLRDNDTRQASSASDVQRSSASQRRMGVRPTDTPPQPDSMVFEYAVDGVVTSLPRDQFLGKLQKLQRVVETLTILDDPNFTASPRDVEIAIRMTGCGRDCTFGLSHVYWA